jgi:hypothetical protein
MYTAMISLCLGLSLSQVPDPVPADVKFWGTRAFKLPLSKAVRRDEARQYTLYKSTDEGKSWDQVGVIGNNEDGFIVRTECEGSHWFQVAVTDNQGIQDPANILDFAKRPERIQKWFIHSVPPNVVIRSAQRQGEDIIVNWEIQEPYPDLQSFKLEYQIQPSPQWNTVQVAPSLIGQARIQPGNLSPVKVRLTMRNRAKTERQAVVDVPGTGVQAQMPLPPADLGLGNIPLVAPPDKLPADKLPSLPPPPQSIVQKPAQDNTFVPPALDRSVTPIPPQSITPSPAWRPTGPMIDSNTRLVADSSATPSAPPVPIRKNLPPVTYVNIKEVSLEYELTKVGPSGVGTVDMWWTRNDGQTWERYADDPEAKAPGRHKVCLPLNVVDDCVVGFILVVRSRAGLGRREPQPGDVPDMRIEIDTRAPVTRLFVGGPDPQRANSLILRWTAEDKNLADDPIDLEWAEQREGPWVKIASNLANTGRFSWQLPERLPVQVYLRVKARDRAGNVGVAATNGPEVVDLSEPVGTLLHVVPGPR